MFSVQTVGSMACAENEAQSVDVQCEAQSVSEITPHDLGEQNIGHGESHCLEQGKTDSTSVKGSYVSLLADIATIEQNDEYSDQQLTHDIPTSNEYANSRFTGQDQIQALTESDLSTSLQTESLVSYQQVQNQNIGYNLNNSDGNAQALQQYVIIQPIIPSFFSDNSASGSSTLIHIPNSSDNQLSLDSNKELEDAVANITEEAVEENTAFIGNKDSPEKSYLVSTNSRGEVRDIQVVQGDQSTVLEVREPELSVHRRKSQLKCVKNKQKKITFTKRKEYSTHLKKFTLDDLNIAGKTKKEIFEEFLGKSKVQNAAQGNIPDRSAHNENKKGFSNEQIELVAEIVKPPTVSSNSSLKAQNEAALMSRKKPNSSEVIAESNFNNLEESSNDICNVHEENLKFDMIEESTKPEKGNGDGILNQKMDNICLEGGNTKPVLETKNDTSEVDIKPESEQSVKMQIARAGTIRQSISGKSEAYVTRSKRQLQGFKAFTTLEKVTSGVSAGKIVALKRKKQMPFDLKKTSKVRKIIDNYDKNENTTVDSPENNIESRVLEDFCRFFKADDKCIIHLEPITLKFIKPKSLLVIEMEVDNELHVSSVEKGVSANGFTKYYLNISSPENQPCNKVFPEPALQKFKNPPMKDRKKQLKNIKRVKRNVKKTTIDQTSLADKETINVNVLPTLKEDGTDDVDNSIDCDIRNENDVNFSDAEDSLEYANINQEDIQSNSKISASETKINDRTDIRDTCLSKNNKTHAKSKQKKDCRVIKQKESKEDKNVKKNTQEDGSQKDRSQKDYQVVITEEGIRMFRCPICGYTSKYTSNAKKHIHEHTAPKDWVCEMCGMSFKNNNSLQKHKIVHQKERPFPCPLCPQKFKRKRMYRCELCGKEMSIRQNMDVHLNQHTGRRPWQCEVCGLRFKGPSNLRTHMHQHEEEMRFSCGICSRKFRDRGTYRQHLKRHLGEKKHVCEHCGKSFVISSDLKKHIRTHTGEKPFKCSVCEQQFSDGSSLVRHEKMHAAKYRFECSACKRQYSRKDLCKKHISKAHAEVGPVEVNQVSIEDDCQIHRDIIKPVGNLDIRANKTQRVLKKSSNKVTPSNSSFRRLKKSWQTLTEEASKRYKEHSVQDMPGTSQYGEYSQPVGPTFSIIDYQHVPSLYENMNQKFSDQKAQILGYSGTQDVVTPQGHVVTPQGHVVFQSYVSEPDRFITHMEN